MSAARAELADGPPSCADWCSAVSGTSAFLAGGAAPDQSPKDENKPPRVGDIFFRCAGKPIRCKTAERCASTRLRPQENCNPLGESWPEAGTCASFRCFKIGRAHV